MILPTIFLDRFAGRLDVVDDEAHMMQPVKILAALVSGLLVGLEFQNCEADRAVGQHYHYARLEHALHAERLLIECRRFLHIRNGDSDMSEFCHGFLHPRCYESWSRSAMQVKVSSGKAKFLGLPPSGHASNDRLLLNFL